MKLKYKHTEKELDHSFYAVRQTTPHLESNWHFHDEFELIYITKGAGIRIVGDSIINFRPPQLVLAGQWLPHVWKNDDTCTEDGSVNVVISKFTRNFSSIDLFSIPEFRKISAMLDLSKRGISFSRKEIRKVRGLMEELPEIDGPQKVINLLRILQILSECKDYKLLSSPEFILPITLYGENRLNRIINYISSNYYRSIDLDDLASEAAMTRSSVCRFFKSRTNKTIFQFINEYRIGMACQLLINGDQTISEICFATGFNSITSFNRVFKNFKNLTPGEFKKQYTSF